jgi:signal transduction histidine kinase
LSNATRHAGGQGVSVSLRLEQRSLRLRVADQGPGCEPDADLGAGHLGLAGMRERAELLGGEFRMRSAPGQGTTVEVTWPLVSEARA